MQKNSVKLCIEIKWHVFVYKNKKKKIKNYKKLNLITIKYKKRNVQFIFKITANIRL